MKESSPPSQFHELTMKKQYLYALLAVLMWGTLAPVTKLLLSDASSALPNYETLFFSSGIAALFLLLQNLCTGKAKKFAKTSGRTYLLMLPLGALGIFLYNLFYFFGIGTLTSQMACVINYLWPVMIVLFSIPFLGETLTARKGLSLALSFAGVVLLVALTPGAFEGEINLWGVLSCFGAALSYGLFSVLNKKQHFDQSVFMPLSWTVAAVGSFALMLCTETFVAPTLPQWLGLLWLGIAPSALAYLFWALALEKATDSAEISNFAFATPFLSLLLSVFLVGESFDPLSLLALALILAGIFLQKRSAKTR